MNYKTDANAQHESYVKELNNGFDTSYAVWTKCATQAN